MQRAQPVRWLLPVGRPRWCRPFERGEAGAEVAALGRNPEDGSRGGAVPAQREHHRAISKWKQAIAKYGSRLGSPSRARTATQWQRQVWAESSLPSHLQLYCGHRHWPSTAAPHGQAACPATLLASQQHRQWQRVATSAHSAAKPGQFQNLWTPVSEDAQIRSQPHGKPGHRATNQ